MQEHYEMADLFCGAGGTSTGADIALRALGYKPRITAVNHWDIAVSTHKANHPEARHLCASLDSLNPRDLYRDRQLRHLWASPECTHHSVARGGMPINDQSRATAWCVVRWVDALRPDIVQVENVPEFRTWGPIGANGRPLKSRKGETFRAWCEALVSLGYTVDHTLLCAADYGDPTTRRRLFVQAVRGRRRIVWPEPTHTRDGAGDLFGTRRRWRSARDCIDWGIPGESIRNRKRPLAPRTIARIEAGLRKFGGEAFLVVLSHAGADESRARDLEQPFPTIPAGHRGEHGLCEPFVIPMEHSGAGALRPVSDPLPTITTARGGAIALAQPFLTKYYGSGVNVLPVTEPLDTVTAHDRFALVEPAGLDIRFRMLQPKELAAAQGFPTGYRFSGTKTDSVRQIGNAVPCHLAGALVAAAVTQDSRAPQRVLEACA